MSAEKLNPVNPGPLGLLGFGMTTILLNLHNAEIIPLSNDIVEGFHLVDGLGAEVDEGVVEGELMLLYIVIELGHILAESHHIKRVGHPTEKGENLPSVPVGEGYFFFHRANRQVRSSSLGMRTARMM